MNYKPFVLFMTILVIFFLLSGTAAAVNKIETPDDLKNIGNTDYKASWTMNAEYMLANNISIEDNTWISIGTLDDPFTGVFNGNKYTITFSKDTEFFSLDYESLVGPSWADEPAWFPLSNGYGLFGNTVGAEIKNLNVVVNGNLTTDGGVDDAGSYFGVLVGMGLRNSAGDTAVGINITNCSVEFGDDYYIKGANYVGGLSGYYEGFIKNTSVNGNISGTDYTGGLSGHYAYGEIRICSASGEVSGVNYVGGLIGSFKNGQIHESFSEIKVKGANFVGGLIGQSESMLFQKCYAVGSIDGADNVGGLSGKSSGFSMDDCYATGSVLASGNNIGGLFGAASQFGIDQSFSSNSITGNYNIGGLVGYSFCYTINNSYSSGPISGESNLGGLVGLIGSGSLTNCYSSSLISLKESSIPYGTVGGIYASAIEEDWADSPADENITNCFYILTNFNAEPKDNFGIAVYDDDLKILSTFTEHDALTENVWSISPTIDLTKIWYIDDGQAYPIHQWQFEVPEKSGSGNGFGHAIVVNSTSEISDLKDDVIQDSSDIPTPPHNSQKEGSQNADSGDGYGADKGGSSWTLYLILGVGFVVVIGGVAYYLNKRNV